MIYFLLLYHVENCEEKKIHAPNRNRNDDYNTKCKTIMPFK